MLAVENKDLLEQLRIDRRAPATAAGSGGPSRWMLVLPAVLAVAAVGGWWLFGRDSAIEVQLASATAIASAPVSASVLDATGYVTARRIATVSSQVTGQVNEVFIEEGQRVEQDQVLATLVADTAGAQFSLAEAQVRQADAQQGSVKAQLRQAEADLKRQVELTERGLTSKVALEQARTQVDQLRAQVEAAGSAVAVARRSLELAQVQLDNTEIRAPFAGVVTVKAAQPGEMISPISAGGGFTRTGIGTIVDMDSLEIQVDVNENFINRVVPGQPVEATLNAYPDWKIPAEVIAIIPTADRSKATVKVRIAFREKDARIVPDMGVRVAFLEERAAEGAPVEAPKGVLVPRAALRREDGKDVVYVAADGRLVRRQVQAGSLNAGDARQVIDGVVAGERVVVAPADGLLDGADYSEKQ
jgi:RND family efflux transporter MFP subunit